jgi:hydrogenase maturation protease
VNPTASEILVIGYGNPLRGDDGLGPFVVDLIAARNWLGVRTNAVQQLTPELAAELAHVRLAVFVDAGVGDCENAIKISDVAPAEPVAAMTHVADPQALLALTRVLYGACPSARLLTISGQLFEVADSLSPTAAANALRAVDCIAEMLQTGAATRRPKDEE